MEKMILVYEVNGKRKGFKGNMHQCNRFIKALCLSGATIKMINTYKLK